MRELSWDYASGLTVKITNGKVLWESWRRGDEWGTEQSVADFIAKGPAVTMSDVPKSVLREMLTELSVRESAWLPQEGSEKTVEAMVEGNPVRFIEDAYLKAHTNDYMQDLIFKMKHGSAEFWKNARVYAGYLAEDTKIRGLFFKAHTELLVHENGNLFIGTLAIAGSIQGLEYEAGSNLIFYKSGGLESGTLAKPVKMGRHTFRGRVNFDEDGKIQPPR